MSNSHVRDFNGGAYTVVFHVATPAGNNSPNLAYSAILVLSGLGGKTVLPDGNGLGTDGGISVTEKASIAAGTLYEVVDTVTPPGNLSGAALLAWLDEHFAARQAEIQAQLTTRFAQWGRVH